MCKYGDAETDQDHLFKAVLKYQNWPIVPAEIENVLLTHPAVLDCCIVGVPHEVYGDLLVAFVLLVKGVEVTEDELKAHVSERVSDAKKLRGGVVFLQDLPMTPSLKVNRKLLKANALQMKEELLAKAD